VYVWTFGDGSTSNALEPAHTYLNPGRYTVSLFYNNDYCDSTLVKNQYIRVVDAPKLGFSVASQRGCAPFLAQFTDTVSLNVTKKEYLFSDSTSWKIVSTPKFNYIFNKPGHYWAVQKLYGYTGCVIRTDSIQLFVSKGVSISDSIHINRASYDIDNILHLHWLPHSASVNYQVLKSLNGVNFSPLNQTKDTFLTDVSMPKSQVFYQVKAMDSCGSFSSSQNKVAPSYIAGITQNGNESAIIHQSLQQGFGLPISANLLGSFNTKFPFNLLQADPSNPFADLNFAQKDYLRKCYHLLSQFNNQEMYSNNFCLDYVPIIFIKYI